MGAHALSANICTYSSATHVLISIIASSITSFSRHGYTRACACARRTHTRANAGTRSSPSTSIGCISGCRGLRHDSCEVLGAFSLRFLPTQTRTQTDTDTGTGSHRHGHRQIQTTHAHRHMRSAQRRTHTEADARTTHSV